MEFLSNIITDEELNNIKPGCFNVLRAPRGWGKTTFMFDERILNFARAKKHVLYLIHNRLTRDAIAFSHGDKAIVFEGKDFNLGWFDKRNKCIFTEEDEDLVHVMCYQTFAALIRNAGVEWLDDIDLIIWDEFDDIKGWYEKEINALKKMLPDFSRERLVATLQEGKSSSIVNFVYQIKSYILEPERIKLIAISATPENAAYYFNDYINYILKGKLEEKYEAEMTFFIDDVIDAIKEGIFPLDRKYWCHTATVTEGFRIELAARNYGFKPLVLWSETNKDWHHLLTQERRDALAALKASKPISPEYNFLIVTSVADRGLNVYDLSFQDWICDSTVYESIVQFLRARFKVKRRYLLNKTKGLIEFTQNGFPAEYYLWHTMEELRQLIEEKPIYTRGMEKKKLKTFNAIKREYDGLWESRKYGKRREQQYRLRPEVGTQGFTV